MLDYGRRDAKTAWLTGGTLLIVAAVLGWAAILGPWPNEVGLVRAGVWAAAVLVFALGWRHSGSVTARLPLGTTALVVAALMPLVQWAVALGSPPPGWLTITLIIVDIAALTVGTVETARQSLLPDIARWAPFVIFVAVTAVHGIALLLAATGAVSGPEPVAILFYGANLLAQLAVAVLGVLAIIYARRVFRHDFAG